MRMQRVGSSLRILPVIRSSGLLSKRHKLISILFNTLPHLYISAYEFCIVQSSAGSHQPTACLAGLLFSVSLHRQIENEFLSMHFTLLETGKSHSGLNLLNGRGLKQWNAVIG
jgi:hypothetical protein